MPQSATKSEQVDAAERLAIGDDGRPLYMDPLNKWRLRFYPDQKYWRRTRSYRNEVPKGQVAREANVSVDVIEAWERAAIRAARS